MRNSKTGVFDDLMRVEISGFVEQVQPLRENSLIPKVSTFMVSENRQFLMSQKTWPIDGESSQRHQSLNR